jgi:DNA-binding transcriptional ArsR family regulator
MHWNTSARTNASSELSRVNETRQPRGSCPVAAVACRTCVPTSGPSAFCCRNSRVVADHAECSVPRDRYYHAISCDVMNRDHAAEVLDEIDRRLTEVNLELQPYDSLVRERERLLRARAALLGEASPARRTAQKRVAQREVADYLKANPGARPGEIASALNVPQPTISAHLYRGKQVRFVSQKGRWYLASDDHGDRDAPPGEVPTRPDSLAAELGIDAKTLRQWLRDTFPRTPQEKNTDWKLGPRQVAAARARWGRPG